MDSVKEENIKTRKLTELHDIYNIKGPLGKGLCIEKTGVHVAFCGGTGVLVFLDLVSHLLLRAYYKHRGEKKPEYINQLDENFKFVFFVTMPCMDAFGLNMCEAL